LSEGAGSPGQPPVDYEGQKQAFVNAIYGQESSHGSADTSRANSQNVIGPMQVKRETFDGMKRNGQIPQWADFNNPSHTKRAGEIHAEYLFDKYKGNPALAAAAYYGGEKAVSGDKIVNFGNKSRPSDPTTTEYATDILRRLGRG
jgi:hypothetical protein